MSPVRVTLERALPGGPSLLPVLVMRWEFTPPPPIPVGTRGELTPTMEHVHEEWRTDDGHLVLLSAFPRWEAGESMPPEAWNALRAMADQRDVPVRLHVEGAVLKEYMASDGTRVIEEFRIDRMVLEEP